MDNKNVLVVGSSGGIGNKVAETLLKIGYRVIGTYYQDFENIENLKKYPNFSNLELNIQQSDSIIKLKNDLKADNLFAIVNCAGICVYENENLENNLSVWEKTIATNLSGNYYLAQTFKDSLSLQMGDSL